jgi:hypothetical protein
MVLPKMMMDTLAGCCSAYGDTSCLSPELLTSFRQHLSSPGSCAVLLDVFSNSTGTLPQDLLPFVTVVSCLMMSLITSTCLLHRWALVMPDVTYYFYLPPPQMGISHASWYLHVFWTSSADTYLVQINDILHVAAGGTGDSYA